MEISETNLQKQGQSTSTSVFKSDKVCRIINNPLDYIGVAHNVILKALIEENPNIENETIFYDAVSKNIKNEFKEDTLELSFNDFDKLIQVFKDIDYKITLNNVKKTNLFSEKQITLMGETEQILISNFTVSIKKEKLIEQEDIVMNNQTFSEKEKNELLVFLATARRSLEFWSDNSDITKTGGRTIVLADALGVGLGAAVLTVVWPISAVAFGVSASYIVWFESTK